MIAPKHEIETGKQSWIVTYTRPGPSGTVTETHRIFMAYADVEQYITLLPPNTKLWVYQATLQYSATVCTHILKN
jgi:hypothetical protein